MFVNAFGLYCLTLVTKARRTGQFMKYLPPISIEEVEPWEAYSADPRVTKTVKESNTHLSGFTQNFSEAGGSEVQGHPLAAYRV